MRLADSNALNKQLNTLEDRLERNAQQMFLGEAERTRQRAEIIGEFSEVRHEIEKLRNFRTEVELARPSTHPTSLEDRVTLLEAENALLLDSVRVLVNAVWENSMAARYIGRLLNERDEESWSAFEGLWRRLGRNPQVEEDEQHRLSGA